MLNSQRPREIVLRDEIGPDQKWTEARHFGAIMAQNARAGGAPAAVSSRAGVDGTDRGRARLPARADRPNSPGSPPRAKFVRMVPILLSLLLVASLAPTPDATPTPS